MFRVLIFVVTTVRYDFYRRERHSERKGVVWLLLHAIQLVDEFYKVVDVLMVYLEYRGVVYGHQLDHILNQIGGRFRVKTLVQIMHHRTLINDRGTQNVQFMIIESRYYCLALVRAISDGHQVNAHPIRFT